MKTIKLVDELKEEIKRWKHKGQSVAFVPTMGNLHQGHLSLVKEAKKKADCVVASIFVNPTQFGVGEDFETYPRTELEDRTKLEQHNTNLLFLPDLMEMYPQGSKTVVEVQGLSGMHCGKSRPGHFCGVATIVCKLLNMVQPDTAFFGKKDFQQWVIIRSLVRDLNLPVEIEGVATVRENDGLAMSSRNNYLSATQRQIAPKLYQSLCAARDEIIAGRVDFKTIEKQQFQILQQAGFGPDYFSICRTCDLQSAGDDDPEIVILTAAKLGKTRLIDNIQVSRTVL